MSWGKEIGEIGPVAFKVGFSLGLVALILSKFADGIGAGPANDLMQGVLSGLSSVILSLWQPVLYVVIGLALYALAMKSGMLGEGKGHK